MRKDKLQEFNCCVEGCDRRAMYRQDRLCQLHYHRRRRNGFFHIKPSQRSQNNWKFVQSGGYIKVKMPDHPLADKQGFVFEHRIVAYAKYGANPPPCEFCGRLSNWNSRATHVDHKDEDRKNNHADNLRILCNPCNVGRNKHDPTKRHNAILVTIDGRTLTCEQWAREPGVVVWGATIRHRIKNGWPPEKAVYAKGITHHGWKPKPPRPPAHTRKNSVAIHLFGETKTAAEWARDPRCSVSRGRIVQRLMAGETPYDSVFKPTRMRKRRMQENAP